MSRQDQFRTYVISRLKNYHDRQCELKDPDGIDRDEYNQLQTLVFELELIAYGIEWMEGRRNDWPMVEVPL